MVGDFFDAIGRCRLDGGTLTAAGFDFTVPPRRCFWKSDS